MPGPVPPPPRKRGIDPDDPFAVLIDPMAGALKLAMKTGATLIEKGAAIWHDPAKAVALAGQGSALTAEIAKLAFMGEDSRTLFKGEPGSQTRGVGGSTAVSEVKAIGRALDCSVNDVLLSSVAGALRSYLERRGEMLTE